MAKIIFSGIGITEMRGKLGSEIFSRNASGAYSKAFTIPANTITALRTSSRDNFASAVSLWSSVDQSQLVTWQELSSRVFKKNSVSQRYKPTARNLFIACNYNLLCAGELPVMVADAFSECVGLKSFTCNELTSSSFRVSPLFVNGVNIVPANHVLTISASVSVSAGIKSKKNGLVHVISFDEGIAISNAQIIAEYSLVFGSPLVGKNVFFSAHTVNKLNGLASVRHFGFSVVS